jgi:hypothetical protein
LDNLYFYSSPEIHSKINSIRLNPSLYPDIRNVRFGTTEMIKDGAEIIIYGETDL